MATPFIARALGAVLAALVVMPAGSAAAGDKWGSIFFSPETHANGFSYRQASRGDAEDAAYSNCDADDCIKATTFRNSCGAVAVGENGGWGANWGENGRAAQRRALNACNGNAEGCRVLRWQCAN